VWGNGRGEREGPREGGQKKRSTLNQKTKAKQQTKLQRGYWVKVRRRPMDSGRQKSKRNRGKRKRWWTL